MSFTSTLLAAVPTVVLTALLAAGCGDGGQISDDRGAADFDSTARSTPTPGPSRSPSDDGAEESAETQEIRMNIQITIDDHSFGATLRDSPAAHDLHTQLPVTVEMVDHGGVEKTGPLPGPLSLDGQPGGADPDVGDLGYYAPGNDLVLYYGDQSYFPGIVVLGQMHGDAAERIASMDGSITATVQAR
jgi:hypothetical protein